MSSQNHRTPTSTRRTSGFGRPVALSAAVLAALLAGVLLSACGSSSSDPSSAAGERAQEAQAEAKFADYARCLREHGINAEALSRPNGGHGLKVSPGKGGPGPESMEAAQKACARYQPAQQKVNLSPQQKVEQEEAVQKFARCMREHGIKVEATAKNGGVQIAIHAHRGAGTNGEPNPESPGFQTAQNNCQKLLPKPPGGASKGPGNSRGGEAGPGTSSSSGAPTEGGGAVAGG
jgi:hypothetical protein